MSSIESRLQALERSYGTSDEARTRADLLAKIETGEIREADLAALYGLMETELRASLLLAASGTVPFSEELLTPDAWGRVHPLPCASPMVYAVWTVAIPPDQEVDPSWAEQISLFGQGSTPLQRQPSQSGLSASQRWSIVLWLRSRLLMAAMGEPTAMTLREAFHDPEAHGVTDELFRLPEPAQLEWLDRIQVLVHDGIDLPLIRGIDDRDRRYIGWMTHYTDDEGETVCRSIPEEDLEPGVELIDLDTWTWNAEEEPVCPE